MKKILVIGCPGAGKSVFARRLCDTLELPLFHLDMIWHRPDKTNISQDEFDTRLKEILATDKWIIDGDYSRTLELRMTHCDTVFFLDYPLELCLASVEARVNKVREDMPWVEDCIDDEFRQWILDFPTKRRPFTYELLDKYKTKLKIHIFQNRKDADLFLQTLYHDKQTLS